ncbi:hypothetical protein [Sphingobium sp.]|uniref:hypothetical protein n=1 Tax=Sphingobium sp. TaxID=1912891 RepID=UPI0035C759BC
MGKDFPARFPGDRNRSLVRKSRETRNPEQRSDSIGSKPLWRTEKGKDDANSRHIVCISPKPWRSCMTDRNRQATRFWNILGKVTALLALLLLLWWLVNGEWLWIFLNAIWQREWG